MLNISYSANFKPSKNNMMNIQTKPHTSKDIVTFMHLPASTWYGYCFAVIVLNVFLLQPNGLLIFNPSLVPILPNSNIYNATFEIFNITPTTYQYGVNIPVRLNVPYNILNVSIPSSGYVQDSQSIISDYSDTKHKYLQLFSEDHTLLPRL